MEDRLTELETRVAFMDDTINQLNDELVHQQKELETLHRMLHLMHEQMKQMTNPEQSNQGEPPPPHY
ncbi:hypothetical protein WH50_19470 [Pokkaliibacter plantistimulans]|uniref:Protein SlyX homolog n=1 Tax=Pokkaliibacter plantistimulans TaxID=1635171 RepID=A0ABX5LVM3_9GAMM|nr:SlyX family protein [Pokkaliibacter plantistimulans]PXF29660.1 hypothetical protein WH50_19470 [Pokkaliibacter plantistimulans]